MGWDFSLPSRLFTFLTSPKRTTCNASSLGTLYQTLFQLFSYFKSLWLGRQELLEERCKEKGIKAEIVPYCAEVEDMVMSMGEEGSTYSEVNNFTSALPNVIHAGFRALDLMQYFTVGKDEVRAWPVRCGASAPEAAGCIHSDFEKAFQTVEVTRYSEFLAHKAENPAFKPLKFNKFGKKYLVEDGDILQFLVSEWSAFWTVWLSSDFSLVDNLKEITLQYLFRPCWPIYSLSGGE